MKDEASSLSYPIVAHRRLRRSGDCHGNDRVERRSTYRVGLLGANSGGSSSSEPIPVVSYDISETPVSGFGGWAHTYSGIIEDTGRRTGPNCAAEGTTIAKYSNGSGTLNDGVTDAANVDSTQLL